MTLAKVEENGFAITLDPTSKFEDMTPQMVMEWCGFLPHWFIEYAVAPLDYTNTKSIKEHMYDSYGFGLHEMTGGEIKEDYTYTYPTDPTLQPLIHIQANEGAEMIQWNYGIVAFRDSDEDDWFTTRMD